MRISDWSSDVCSSDLHLDRLPDELVAGIAEQMLSLRIDQNDASLTVGDHDAVGSGFEQGAEVCFAARPRRGGSLLHAGRQSDSPVRSEEHTSELQSLMRISYAVFCLKKKHEQYTTKRSTSYT